MSVKQFFETHAGKATLGVYLAVLLIVWPPALAWLTAAGLIGWSARHLRLAFIAAKREQRMSLMEEIEAQRQAPVPVLNEAAEQAA